MCGIAGRVNFRSGAPVDGAVIQRMCHLLAHRGPDGEGTHVDGPVGLGHRRLAIIDLSPAARQPMASEDARLWITYNGEVYNFRELRADLERRGRRFRSQSDTEVILAAYREFGVGCLDRFRGMYAFAVWDSRARTLFLARDRLGKKPLYYLLDDDGIAFASEPKAFLADASFKAEPDLEAISHYLTYQYVPSPLTAFQGLQKLPPAHYLLVQEGKVSVARHWRLRYRPKHQLTEQQACEELLAQLREAVRLRLISDVPLGALLSGGVDSSTVVALMTELSTSRVRTFSIGFEEAAYDEREAAAIVADRFGTDHHAFVVRPDAAALLPALVWHYNEPFADSSAVPTYYLAQVTRPHVTVALSGDGGDEAFGGYERYVAHALACRADRVLGPLRPALAALGAVLPRGGNSRGLRRRARRFLEALVAPPADRYARWMVHFTAEQKATLCTPEFAAASGDTDPLALLREAFTVTDAEDPVEAAMAADVACYLPEDLLVKLDVATMAHGLEARCPFLDSAVVEFAARLPVRWKVWRTAKKVLLRRALRDLLPPEILGRPKQGFGVPIDAWLRGPLKELAFDTLLSPRATARGLFRPAAVRQLLEEHVSGGVDRHYQIWNLLILELWHQMFIDRRHESAPPSGDRASTVERRD